MSQNRYSAVNGSDPNAAAAPAGSDVAVPVGYQGGAQPTVVVGANIPVGQSGHVAPGSFSDSLWSCFDSWPICCLSFWISPLRWASSMERLNFMTHINAIMFYGIPWLLGYIFELIYDVSGGWPWILLCIAFNIVQIYLGMTYREKIRNTYQIPGEKWEDCLLHTFCRCCAIAQEARHIDRDLAIPI